MRAKPLIQRLPAAVARRSAVMKASSAASSERDEIFAELGAAQAEDLRIAGDGMPVDEVVHRTRSALLAQSDR